MAGVQEEADRVQNWRRGPRFRGAGEKCDAPRTRVAQRERWVCLGGLGKLTGFLTGTDWYSRTTREKKNTAPDRELGELLWGVGGAARAVTYLQATSHWTVDTRRDASNTLQHALKALPRYLKNPLTPTRLAHFSFFGGGFPERVRCRRFASLALVTPRRCGCY